MQLEKFVHSNMFCFIETYDICAYQENLGTKGYRNKYKYKFPRISLTAILPHCNKNLSIHINRTFKKHFVEESLASVRLIHCDVKIKPPFLFQRQIIEVRQILMLNYRRIIKVFISTMFTHDFNYLNCKYLLQ